VEAQCNDNNGVYFHTSALAFFHPFQFGGFIGVSVAAALTFVAAKRRVAEKRKVDARGAWNLPGQSRFRHSAMPSFLLKVASQ
jgi:hypothetical protein